MVVTPLRLFLFVAAAFVAAVGTAYYTGALEAYFAPVSPQVAQEEPLGAGTDPAARATPAQDETKAETAQSGTAGETASKSAAAQDDGGNGKGDRVVVPAFDVVRVEPDGSMVIAGRAAPRSNVEIVSGSTIVGKSQSGPAGDFAVVLDEPLKPGNYQIVLRATSPGDVVATSKETAVVSVPDNNAGAVLALVEEPGKPSRLITKPAAVPGDANDTAEADEAPAGEESASANPAGQATRDQSPVAMAEPSAGTATDAGSAEPGATASKAAASAESENASAPAAASAVGKAGADAMRVVQGDSAVSGGAAQDGKAAAGGDRGEVKIFIEAVEIDGKDIFVAGGGVAGKRVRVYANDTLLGDAVVSPNGRFLVQATRELAVGDYIVRADLLSDNGADVVARAAVPFEREPGEKLAAVAPDVNPGGAGEKTTGNAAAAGTTVSASAAEKGTGQESGAAPPVSQDTSKTLADKAGQAASAPQGGNATAPAGTAMDATSTREGTAAPEAGGGEGGMKLPALDNGLAENAPVITAPKLESVDGAVIIRRGDTLWQISRRVYGHGVRYSTIYLANQGQIRDPDLIWPGQVFTVPEKSETGEAADMKAIGDQAVPADMAGTEPDWRR